MVSIAGGTTFSKCMQVAVNPTNAANITFILVVDLSDVSEYSYPLYNFQLTPRNLLFLSFKKQNNQTTLHSLLLVSQLLNTSLER